MISYQKRLLTSSIFVAQVRKSPNVGQIHREANDWQQKVYFLAPSFSVDVGGGSARSRAPSRGGDDGGTGVLDTILVLHQYQFYFFLLHIALLQRGDRRELVFWQNLDVHLVGGCVQSPRGRAALTAPCGFLRSRWLKSWRWVEDRYPAGKNLTKELSPV